MPPNTPVDQKLIADISKTIVGEVAPEEIDLFDELLHDYFANPAPPDLAAKPVDEPLGWGAGEVMVDEIDDKASIAFSAAFYQALGYCKDVPTAFRLGISQIKLYGLADSVIPQLLMQ